VARAVPGIHGAIADEAPDRCERPSDEPLELVRGIGQHRAGVAEVCDKDQRLKEIWHPLAVCAAVAGKAEEGADHLGEARAGVDFADHDGFRVLGSPWTTAWVTAGVVPVGFSLLPASEPRLLSLAEPIPLPPDIVFGRRLGVALVQDGDHVLLEAELPRLARGGTKS